MVAAPVVEVVTRAVVVEELGAVGRLGGTRAVVEPVSDAGTGAVPGVVVAGGDGAEVGAPAVVVVGGAVVVVVGGDVVAGAVVDVVGDSTRTTPFIRGFSVQ